MVAGGFNLSITVDNYLSVKELLSELIGHPTLIIFVFLIVVTYACIKFNVDYKTTLFINLLVLAAISSFIFDQVLIIVFAMIIVFILYGTYAKFFSK